MDTDALVALVRLVAVQDRWREWVARRLFDSEREDLRGSVLDPSAPIGRGGFVIDCDRVPVVAVVDGRLHWNAMSVALSENSWRAAEQLLRAIDAVTPGTDSRPQTTRTVGD